MPFRLTGLGTLHRRVLHTRKSELQLQTKYTVVNALNKFYSDALTCFECHLTCFNTKALRVCECFKLVTSSSTSNHSIYMKTIMFETSSSTIIAFSYLVQINKHIEKWLL
jgi:hypothetical protein